MHIHYQPPPTIQNFMQSDALVKGIMGPVGSGKSSGCCWELFRRMCAQPKAPDGKRKSRWLVVRNTYAELLHTTIRTFQDWLPPEVFGGNFTRTPPMRQTLRFNDVEAEVIFLALDRAEDAAKLRSFECTGAWVNEAALVPWEVVRTLLERIGRYPSVREGGAPQRGVILDTNPPPEDHWWFQKFEIEKPDGWAVFRQPSGLSPQAENVAHLPPDYYQSIVAASGADPERIRVMVEGKYGTRPHGFAVFGTLWDEAKHVAMLPLAPLPLTAGKSVVVGMDFGLTPAAVFLQQHAGGQWQILHELVADSVMGAEQFAPLLKQVIQQHFLPQQEFEFYGDPAGSQRSQADARTAFEVLRGQGLLVRAAPVQNLADRLGAVRAVLARADGMKVSPKCPRIRAALRGDYRYQELKTSDGIRALPTPEKNHASHVADALQYALCGGGEYLRLKAGKRRPQSHYDLNFVV